MPVINMDKFRSQLGSEYSTSFPNNEAGDAHSFLNFCHNFLKRVEKAVGNEDDVYSSTFQIKYLVTFTDEEGAMEAVPVITDFISFPAYEIFLLKYTIRNLL